MLKGISIVDTPGILSGEKQRTDRGYDFIGVLEWFAERVDRILLLFDAHKLDISKPMYVMNFHELAAYYFQISMPYPAMDRTDRQKNVTHFSYKEYWRNRCPKSDFWVPGINRKMGASLNFLPNFCHI